ncbi:MAG: hypothetical protein LKI25_07735 [Atopobiaceae bacterium]|jgi:hypothetical protein|nr:hypothetical protein [Atopobiaceae bacterium]MCI2174078.1 hypothetical protein [Atopobiaceae bacterium]MCI2207832.1 hypothetical protein [Atopobiaceae bacterium]
MTRRRSPARIGPITLLTLVAVICLSVMAVLVATTANASEALSVRQASYTSDAYLLEDAGQRFVSKVDDSLAEVRAAGGSADEASSAVDADLPSITTAVKGEVVRADVEASVDGDTVSATLTCASGRRLDVTLTIGDGASVDVSAWRLSTVTDDGNGDETLWSGDSSGE